MKKAGELLSFFLDEQVYKKARGYSDLFSSWTAIMGDPKIKLPTAAAHSRIRELERYILLVEVDHPGWIQLLQTKEREILNAVRRRFSTLSIKGISFRLSRDPETFCPSWPAQDREPSAPKVPDREIPREREEPAQEPGLASGNTTGDGFEAALKRLEQCLKRRR
jgi:hypothetical protein